MGAASAIRSCADIYVVLINISCEEWQKEDDKGMVRTRELDEEIRNVGRERGVARRVVVHLVLLPRLVLDDIEQDVDRRVRVVRRGAVSVDHSRSVSILNTRYDGGDEERRR